MSTNNEQSESPLAPPDASAAAAPITPSLYRDEPLAEPLKPLELPPVSPCRHDGHWPIRPEWPASPEPSSSPQSAVPSESSGSMFGKAFVGPASIGTYWPPGSSAETVASAPPAPDPVNHPAHYNSSAARCLGCGRPIECIDVIEHLPCCIGSILKYLWRCDLKHASPLEDLRKARWYLDREIERRTRQQADQQRGGEA